MKDIPEPILIVGGYGYRNVGDEAILAGLVRRLHGRRVTVVSRAPADTTALHGVAAISVRDAIGALRRHRSLLIGGGGLFGRDMGRVGRLLPLYGLLAIALGRTVIVDGVGIDDAMPASRQMLVRALLRRAASVTVRDSASKRVLDGWGIAARVEPDRSFDMEPAAAEAGGRLLREAGVDLDRPVIGLCLTGLNEEMATDVFVAADELISALPGVEFCFIPMSAHPAAAGHDDRSLGEALRERHPRLRIFDPSAHPAVVLAAFAHLAGAVCMRYHSVLFAHRTGVPFVAVPYAPKVSAWLDEHGLAAVATNGRAWTDALRVALAERVVDPLERLAS
ncbi:MAG: polysaccharide pyruvyl transferase family protein [Chloroflexota bacterium]